MRIKDVIKNQNARFVFYQDEALFYETVKGFQFPIPIADAGSATIYSQEKAILLMRYIRKHIAKTEEARNAQAQANIDSRSEEENIARGNPHSPS